jgi:threonine dehydratase
MRFHNFPEEITPTSPTGPLPGGRVAPPTATERTRVRIPTFADVLEARRRIAPYLQPTPLHNYPSLDRLVGAEVWVKHENHQPIGAFKVRGGINLISQLDATERARGVITASTGNHGQSIAYAARLFGVPATVCVPEGANPVKLDSMRSLGARIVVAGADFDEAREHCERLAASGGLRYVHSGDEPLLIAGVGTETLEIVEARPDLDTLIVPIGGGSGAAGACLVAGTLGIPAEVIGVQSAAAPAAYRSWAAKALVADKMGTFAEGLATRTAFELPQRILWQRLDDFVLVEERELREATYRMIELTRNLVEPAGAAALAGALRLRPRLAGRRVGLIASGGNISPDQLREVLAAGTPDAGHARGAAS